MFREWLRGRTGRRVSGRRATGFRPGVECLDERVLLSTTPVPIIVDYGRPGYSESGTWSSYPDGHNDSLRAVNKATVKGTAAYATWQVDDLEAGKYDVQVTWVADSNRATDVEYLVYDGSTLLATVVVNQRLAPSGVTAGGTVFKSLGKFTTTTGTLKVKVDNFANGLVVADAMRLGPTKPSAVVVDHGTPGYGEVGAWGSFGAGFGGSLRYFVPGSSGGGAGGGLGPRASWQVADLTPGKYDVQVTWLADPANRASNATYQIFDGNTLLATRVIDQRTAPTGTQVADSVYQNLGRFHVSSGSVRVVLLGQGDGTVVADAARFKWVPPLTGGDFI